MTAQWAVRLGVVGTPGMEDGWPTIRAERFHMVGIDGARCLLAAEVSLWDLDRGTPKHELDLHRRGGRASRKRGEGHAERAFLGAFRGRAMKLPDASGFCAIGVP